MHPPNHPTLLTDEDLVGELATARREVDRLVGDVRSFSVVHHEQPWVHLDDLLADLRAAAVTVSVLEQLQDRRR